MPFFPYSSAQWLWPKTKPLWHLYLQSKCPRKQSSRPTGLMSTGIKLLNNNGNLSRLWLLTHGTKQSIAKASSGIRRQAAFSKVTPSAIASVSPITPKGARKSVITQPTSRQTFWTTMRKDSTWKLTLYLYRSIPSWAQLISTSCGGAQTFIAGSGLTQPPKRSSSFRIMTPWLRSTTHCTSRGRVWVRILESAPTTFKCSNVSSHDNYIDFSS